MPLRRRELPRKHAGAKEKAASPEEAARAEDLGGLSPHDGGTREEDKPRCDGARCDGARVDKARFDKARFDGARCDNARCDGRCEKAARVQGARAPWTLTATSAPAI